MGLKLEGVRSKEMSEGAGDLCSHAVIQSCSRVVVQSCSRVVVNII